MAKTKGEAVSRRGFMAAVGAAAATAAVAPAVAVVPGTWRDTKGAVLEAFRLAYEREIERFAKDLEPEFRAGRLYACRDEEGWEGSAHDRLEGLAAKRFGLEVNRIDKGQRDWFEGDDAAAYLILAVSPTGKARGVECYHPAYDAQSSVAWDVLRVARRRGWYVVPQDECSDPVDDEAQMRAEDFA